jgi:hypothetical protein
MTILIYLALKDSHSIFSTPAPIVGVVPSFVFGLPVVNIAEISLMTLFAFATPEIFPLIPERAEVATLFFGSPVTSIVGHWGSGRVICA